MDALITFLTIAAITSPVWGGAWLLVRDHRRRATAAAAAALARAWADAEQNALWEARKVGPEIDVFGSAVVHVRVVRVARLNLDERTVGASVPVTSVITSGRRGRGNPRFLQDVEEAMTRARNLADDMNATSLV